jgi:uncharacterized membrane protein YphA (DoxX/SURF4 family)
MTELKKDWAHFSLRIGLGLFILIWGAAKFIQVDMWAEMFSMIYWGLPVGRTLLFFFGIFQVILAVALFLGFYVRIAAWTGFGLQALTTLAIIGRVVRPFGVVQGDPVGPSIVLFSTVPLLAAWLALALYGKAGALAVDAKIHESHAKEKPAETQVEQTPAEPHF